MTDDDREMLIETHTLTKQVHSAVFGNGKPGLKTEMDSLKSAFATVKMMVLVGVGAITLAATVIGLVIT